MDNDIEFFVTEGSLINFSVFGKLITSESIGINQRERILSSDELKCRHRQAKAINFRGKAIYQGIRSRLAGLPILTNWWQDSNGWTRFKSRSFSLHSLSGSHQSVAINKEEELSISLLESDSIHTLRLLGSLSHFVVRMNTSRFCVRFLQWLLEWLRTELGCTIGFSGLSDQSMRVFRDNISKREIRNCHVHKNQSNRLKESIKSAHD